MKGHKRMMECITLTIPKEYFATKTTANELVLHREIIFDSVLIGVTSNNITMILFRTLKKYGPGQFIYEVSKLTGTLRTTPVTSMLCRLKTYLRSTMSNFQLNDIALLHSYNEIDIIIKTH